MSISWDTWCKIVQPAYIKYYDQSVLFSETLFHECLKKLKSLTKTTTRKITLLIVYCVPNTGYTVCYSNPTTNSHSSQYFLHFKSRKADVQRVQVTYAIPQSTDILWDFALQWSLNTMARGRGIQQVEVHIVEQSIVLWAGEATYIKKTNILLPWSIPFTGIKHMVEIWLLLFGATP